MSHSGHHAERNSLAASVEKYVEVKSQKCYQCGKCSAGCPVADEMDYPPSMVMRMLQTETPANDEKLLKSHSIWLCVTCEMCLSRCPMEIDIPSAMDFLRQKSMSEHKENPKAKNIIAFHKAFLNSIKNTGRLYELGLILNYKMKSLNMTQDMALGPKMFSRGKLHIFPEKIKDTNHISKIFKNTEK
ncbi:MAG: heterodisulfide reductase subunit C [Bacteroidetes bacterium GWA2_30_7]|nr:MAG: heterodisulfide reductase subunit C [Bacteroidetes bacterium GWA2_30_7]